MKLPTFQSALSLLLLASCCGGPRLAAQAPSDAPAQAPASAAAPAAAPKAQTGAPQAAPDPTQRQVQGALNVDRDPILSPDPEDNAPVSPSMEITAHQLEQIRKQQGSVFTLHEDVNEVLLQCAVIDEKGRLVKDLKQEDFKIWEDNVPQTVASFRHADLPVSLGFVVDNSGSMADKRPAVRSAALDLVRASNHEDAAFVVNFSDTAILDQDMTSDLGALEHGLSQGDSKGPTAMYDAVVASADELARDTKRPKQVLLVITDGEDNASRLGLDQAVRRVQRLGGPVVYTIGMLFDGESKQKSDRARSDLETLSAETGGIAYFPKSLSEMGQIAQEVAQDVRNQYTLGYHSTRAAELGGYRTVHVEVKAPKRGKLIVRTRHGYYPRVIDQQQAAQNNGTVQRQDTPPAAPAQAAPATTPQSNQPPAPR